MNMKGWLACALMLMLAACADKPGLTTGTGERAGEAFHITELEIVPADSMLHSHNYNDMFKDEIQELKDYLPGRLLPRLRHVTDGDAARLRITVTGINLYTNAVKTILIGDQLMLAGDLDVIRLSDNTSIGTRKTSSFGHNQGGIVDAVMDGLVNDEEEEKIKLMDKFSTNVIVHLYPSSADGFPPPPVYSAHAPRPVKEPELIDSERPALYDAPVPSEDGIPPLRLPQ
ncbi:hypothetical protein GC177_08305 [bacterium]|nr:hypothetical protein [bacterium]